MEYLNVYLYGDENQTFKKRLQDGYRDGGFLRIHVHVDASGLSGKLKSDIQRKSFPTHYVLLGFHSAASLLALCGPRCMTIEQMNCGSVQNWLDKEMLSPQGCLADLTIY